MDGKRALKRSDTMRGWLRAGILAAAAALLVSGGEALGYVEVALSLGKVVRDSTNIVVVRVESVDKEKNLIVYRKVRDLKGTHKGDTIKHAIGQRGFHPREWQNVMAWAEPGKTAMFFHNGSAGEMCIENYWYQIYAGEWWALSHAEPFLLRSFAGKPEKLADAVAAILEGQEVLVPCMVDGDKNALQLRTARMQRMRASLKLQDYNAARDFAGWGVEEFRVIGDMPGFTHVASLNRLGLDALGVAPTDIDADGKPDLCLFGAGRVVMLQNEGQSFNEMRLPLNGVGARAAAWADANGDDRPDLLLATPLGPKVFVNDGALFTETSTALPPQAYYNLTAGVWIDYNGDKRPDILLADGFRGLRLYRNQGPPPSAAPAPKEKAPAVVAGLKFEDVSDRVGLGEKGVGGHLKGDHLAVADVNGDGRPDFLYSAGTGLLVLNTPQGFVAAKDAGISYKAGKVAPAFGDFDGDGHADLFVPQEGTSRLLKNSGTGRFEDVTSKAGAIGRPTQGFATCAVWADMSRRGRPDLMVGCVGGPNRYFRNNGDGTFADASEEIGLLYRIFNTRGLSVVDINKDGVPDLILNNEGQDSTALLGNRAVLTASTTKRR